VYQVFLQGCADPLQQAGGDAVCGAEQVVPGYFSQAVGVDPEQAAQLQTAQSLQAQVMEKAGSLYELMWNTKNQLRDKSSLTPQEEQLLALAEQVVSTGKSQYAVQVWANFENAAAQGPQTVESLGLAGDTKSSTGSTTPSICQKGLDTIPGPTKVDTLTKTSSSTKTTTPDDSTHSDPRVSASGGGTASSSDSGSSTVKTAGIVVLSCGVVLLAGAVIVGGYAAAGGKLEAKRTAYKAIIADQELKEAYALYKKSPGNYRDINVLKEKFEKVAKEFAIEAQRTVPVAAVQPAAIEVKPASVEVKPSPYQFEPNNVDSKDFAKRIGEGKLSLTGAMDRYLRATVTPVDGREIRSYRSEVSKAIHETVLNHTAKSGRVIRVAIAGAAAILVGVLMAVSGSGGFGLAGEEDRVTPILTQAGQTAAEIQELFANYHQALSGI